MSNLLQNTKVYLVGPVEFSSDGVSWREDMGAFFNNMGVKVYDPLKKKSFYPERALGNPKEWYDLPPSEIGDTAKFIVDVCYRFAHDCDFMVVNLPREFTVGSIDEIKIAATAKKPIFIVNKDGIPSTWLMGLYDHHKWDDIFFKDWGSLKEHIRLIDNGEKQVDPLDWIFLSYFQEKEYVRLNT